MHRSRAISQLLRRQRDKIRVATPTQGAPLEDLQKAEWYLQRAIDNGEKCRLQIDGDPLDAHNLMQVGKCRRYMDVMLDLDWQAITFSKVFSGNTFEK